MSSAYHPQTDGQTEVTNRTLEQYLRAFVFQNPHKWEDVLAWAEYWYNTTYHASTKKTPFEYLYGRPPPNLIHYNKDRLLNAEVDTELSNRDELLRELKRNLEKANNRAKMYYDRGHREEHFEVADWVFLKIPPHKQKSVTQKALFKLGSRFYGPYKVLQLIGEVAYRLELPSTAHIHSVFHVSQLKRRVGNSSIVETQLPVIDQDGMLFSNHLEPLNIAK